MSDYETPKVPPATPPVIDPDVDPDAAGEIEADGEPEGEALAEKKKPDDFDIEAEEAMRPAMEGGRGDDGEQALNAAIMLPPD